MPSVPQLADGFDTAFVVAAPTVLQECESDDDDRRGPVGAPSQRTTRSPVFSRPRADCQRVRVNQSSVSANRPYQHRSGDIHVLTEPRKCIGDRSNSVVAYGCGAHRDRTRRYDGAGRELVMSFDPPPPEIVTPDALNTRLGPVEFVNGAPTEDAVARVYAGLDFTARSTCS